MRRLSAMYRLHRARHTNHFAIYDRPSNLICNRSPYRTLHLLENRIYSRVPHALSPHLHKVASSIRAILVVVIPSLGAIACTLNFQPTGAMHLFFSCLFFLPEMAEQVGRTRDFAANDGNKTLRKLNGASTLEFQEFLHMF